LLADTSEQKFTNSKVFALFLASGSTANPAKSTILAYFKEIWYLMFFAAM